MKTNKSFGMFMLNVWATIMRVLFPRYCVKCLTLKTRRHAEKYLPGEEKELALICKLDLSDEEIAKRVWSYETKLALLKRECFALVSEIKTEKELDIVLDTRKVEAIVSAMRVYTPSRAKVLSLLEKSTPAELSAYVKEVPVIFDSLKPWEILGVKEGATCATDSKTWKLAVDLATVRSFWAPLFMTELRNIPPQRLEDSGKMLMCKFFDIAFKAKLDLSGFMPYLYVFFPELYLMVRNDFKAYNNFAPYFVMMFPQLIRYLKTDNTKNSVLDINFPKSVENEEEAYVWLYIGYMLLAGPRVYALMLEHLPVIKPLVSEGIFNDLLTKMISLASATAELKRLSEHSADTSIQQDVQKRVLELASKRNTGVNLAAFFPFEGWGIEQSKRAIALMAERKQFAPFVNRLNELSNDYLKQFASREMETQSQIDALSSSKLEELVSTVNLHPGAEMAFFKMTLTRHFSSETIQYLKEKYVVRFSINADVFRMLVLDRRYVTLEDAVKLIEAYAKKWRLREHEYQLIMQSSLSEYAPFWQKYIAQ